MKCSTDSVLFFLIPVSFFGGSHEEGIPSSQQESVRVGFGFRSIQDSGVLLILRLEDSDSVSFTLSSGNQLQVLLNQGGKITPLGSTTFTADFDGAWQRFEAVLLNGTLETRLQEVSFMVYTFTAPLQVQRVSFGGPRSFFEPVYLDFPVPWYYVGCLSNITLNSRDVLPDPLSAGISLGCCIAPRYPLWCVGNSATHNNLTLSFSHLANYTTELMVMSFRLRLRSTDDGLLVLSHPLTSPWTLHLLQGQLQLKPTSSGANWMVYCPGVFRDVAEWHQVEILLNSSSIVCEVDGIAGPAVVFTIEPSPSFPHTLQLGGTSNVPEAISGSGFDGCFQRLRLNGMDIDVTLLDGVSDVSSVIQPSRVLWSEPSSNVSELVVSAGGEYRLSTDDILLQLPHDAFADELTMPYQLEVERSIHFVALTRPHYGHLFIGHPATRVEGFDYQNLLTSDPAQQIGYSHEGEDNITDVVVFRVWTGCADTVLAELLQLTLLISIEQRDTAPRIIQSESLRLAVGTRRVITPEMMTVFNPESSDPSQILFNLDSVSLKSSGCGSCDGGTCEGCEEGDGGVLVKNGVSIKFFNQEEINRGLISFQHYERFSTAPLLIRLGVTVQGGGGGQMDATIPVSVYQGHLNLISTSCLFVKEGGLGLLKAKHLSAVTDFEEEEDPVITYHLLTQPLYGNLQRYDPIVAQWMELTNSTMTHTLPFGGTSSSSFTQEDIENGHVRYFQSKFLSNNAIETFDFRLQSYDFSGPEINFCVTLLPDDELLLQPSFTVDLSELVLLESSSAAINHSVLNISLENVDYLLIEPDLDLQELGIIYTLVDPTAYGVLELRGLPLAAGDMFVHSDVTSNSLVYRHGGTEDHLDRFSFFVEGNSTPYIPIRAPNRTSNMTVVIHITAVNNHFPALVALEAIRPPEGCWVPVTERNINITDLDRPPNPLGIYLRKPRKPSENPNGFFTFRGESIQAIVRFSMQEVVSESIIFKHTLNSSASLNYTQVLRIDDGHNVIRKVRSIN